MPLIDLSPQSEKVDCNLVHQNARSLLQDTFPIQINGYKYTQNEVWDTLIYASSNCVSINSACDLLQGSPSANWMYNTLDEELFNPISLHQMEQEANRSLRESLPKGLKKKRQKVAMDLVLIPFYGDTSTDGIVRSKAKRSTTKFFCYASAYLIRKNKRVTICFSYVRAEDTLLGVLRRLEAMVQEAGIKIKRLYLDRGFGQVDVIRYLKEQSYVSVVALPKKGERMKELQKGKRSYTTTYRMRSGKGEEVSFPLWIACRYQRGKGGKKGVKYLFFAVIGECRSPILQVAQEYKKRFGIETSYRIMNSVRARTTSVNPSLRLLLVFIAFLLANLWVWLKWRMVLVCRGRGREEVGFSLDVFKLFLSEAIKEIYGVTKEVKL